MLQLTAIQVQLQKAAEPCPIKDGRFDMLSEQPVSLFDCPPILMCPVTISHSLELLNCFNVQNRRYVTTTRNI